MDFGARRDDVDICSVATSYAASDFQFGLARSPSEIERDAYISHGQALPPPFPATLYEAEENKNKIKRYKNRGERE